MVTSYFFKIRWIFLLLSITLSVRAQESVTFEPAFPNLRFQFPAEIQNAGDGSDRLFVVEQSGRIKVFDNDENTSEQNTFLDLSDVVSFSSGQEIGLLGLAFHPNYRQNGYFYVYHTRNSNVSGVRVEVVIARYRVSNNDPDRANASSRLEILSFDKNQNQSNHNGGKIAFGPDGYLYASIGDGGGAGDPERNAQDLSNPFGAILRIDVDLDGSNPVENNPDAPNGNYEIPSDNPRVGRSGLDELYAWGIRNTWKFSFDGDTDRLWAADVGQGEREEINLIENGGNYGWNRFEGTRRYPGGTDLVTRPDTKPIFEYNHDNGDVSITGGYVYRGASTNSLLAGRYIYGDYISGRVWSLDYDPDSGDASSTLLFRTNGQNVSSFGLDESGELYFSGYGNSAQLYNITGGDDQGPSVTDVEGVGSWTELANGTNGIVNALAVDGGTTFVGGDFSRAGSTSANNIASYRAGRGWRALSGGANGTVNALAVDSDGNLYAGGDFSSIGGVSARNIAVWNGSSWRDIGGTNG
ncbi:MAG: PQQ-dependent sugar dehydrogenase, partial [Pricia sp.]